MRDVAIVSGYFIRCALGGYAWQVLHYLCGLRAAGFDAFFYEDTARYADCYDPTTGYMTSDPEPGVAKAREFFGANGFGDKWIFWDALRNGHYGRSAEETREVLTQARLVISLAAVNWIPRETRGTRVFIDLDPGVTQIQAETDAELHGFLSTYAAHFTVGTNIGQPCCTLPTAGFEWHATRPPVALDGWAPNGECTGAFTTVGRWDERRREMVVNGESYSWRKRQEWLKFLTLPRVTGAAFEIAMDVDKVAGDRVMLEEHGWKIRDPLAVSGNPETYRRFIRSSRGEFTVAKDLNVRLASGWFSDRAVCYLAAGRPVIMQDTGFGRALRLGAGLLSFRTLEEAAAAVRDVEENYTTHSRAARQLACDCFDAGDVIRDLLQIVG